MVSFLTEINGPSPQEIEVLEEAPAGYDILSVVAAPLPREAEALTSVDLLGEARTLPCPVTLLVGARALRLRPASFAPLPSRFCSRRPPIRPEPQP